LEEKGRPGNSLRIGLQRQFQLALREQSFSPAESRIFLSRLLMPLVLLPEDLMLKLKSENLQ